MYRLIEMGEGARIEKKDEESYNNHREIAKIIPTDNKREAHKVLNELREIIERTGDIKEIVKENKELMKKLE